MAGKNFANHDPNVDLRALRAAQIRHLTTAPDVVIFGGSRWQEARERRGQHRHAERDEEKGGPKEVARQSDTFGTESG